MAPKSQEDINLIVYITGFCEGGETWAGIKPYISWNNSKLEYFDVPGIGTSKQVLPSMQDLTIRKLAEYFKMMLSKHHANTKYIVLGHSLGGYIALELAKIDPNVVAGCMINSTPFADTNERKELRLRTMEFVKEHGLDKFFPTFFNSLVDESNKVSSQPTINKAIEFAEKNVDLPVFLLYQQAMMTRADNIEYLKNATIPWLFIAGQEDKLIPLEVSRKVKEECPALDYQEIESCGHHAIWEKPETAGDKVLAFLNKHFIQ